MWSPRAQSDRMQFAIKWRMMLEDHPNIDFWQDMVKELIVEDNRVKGVVTGMGLSINSKSVVLTNGTFLNGIIHIGEKQIGGGRSGESAAKGIAPTVDSLASTKKYSEELSKAAAQMESLNNLYKLQLESASVNAEANKDIAENAAMLKQQMQSMTANIASLNAVYGGMLSAMSNKG